MVFDDMDEGVYGCKVVYCLVIWMMLVDYVGLFECVMV